MTKKYLYYFLDEKIAGEKSKITSKGYKPLSVKASN